MTEPSEQSASPDHPVNVYPALGVAESDATVPVFWKLPLVYPVMEALPDPLVFTVTEYLCTQLALVYDPLLREPREALFETPTQVRVAAIEAQVVGESATLEEYPVTVPPFAKLPNVPSEHPEVHEGFGYEAWLVRDVAALMP